MHHCTGNAREDLRTARMERRRRMSICACMCSHLTSALRVLVRLGGNGEGRGKPTESTVLRVHVTTAVHYLVGVYITRLISRIRNKVQSASSGLLLVSNMWPLSGRYGEMLSRPFV